jgi:mannose-6-phosphate isomerase-like protein (cupin superfamily)
MTRFAARPAATSTILVDDSRVRVTRYDFVAGADTGWHRHGLDYVVVPMTECHFLIEEDKGSRRVDLAAGAAYRRDAGAEHNVVNGGDAPMAFIEIEMKT